ncbi:hypothetical protein M8J77_006098 [Diaphorina citri]|nr:hypothetical protein M8J77_006098 [Diaphorina citri]
MITKFWILFVKITKHGEPDTRPQRGDLCVISGFGKLEDDTLVETFDNLEICVGDLELVHGMDYVLPLMETGEECQIEITARFGYGDKGEPSKSIPPGAKLYYSLTLHSVLPDFDLAELPVEKRLDFGVKRKHRGNWFYSRGDNSFAVQCYRRSLDFLDSSNMDTNNVSVLLEFETHSNLHGRASQELLDSLIKERINCYNNLAQAQIKLGSLEPALMSLENVLNLDPNNIKALQRKAKVLAERNEVDEAIALLKRASSLLDEASGERKALAVELKALYAKQKDNTAKEKEIYRKMFNKPVGDVEDRKKKKPGSSSSFNKV